MDKDMISAFVFVFMALGAFVVFINLIPTDFYTPSKTYADQDMPEGETWQAIYLQASNQSKQIRLNATVEQYAFDIGGRNLLLYVTTSDIVHNRLKLVHRYGLGTLWEEAMDWYNEEQYNHGSLLEYWALNDDYEDFGRLAYTVKCEGLAGGWGIGYSSRFSLQALYSFNTTLYDNPDEAWQNNALYLYFGITFDQSNTAINAWDMIGRLLLFQRVDIFGTSTEANAMDTIMSFNLWAFIAVLAFIVIMELIPF